jgi:hypothetical protein
MLPQPKDDTWRGWSRVLDADELRLNLSAAGLFLIGYEFLKGSLGRDKDVAVASLLWFQSSGAITESDVAEFHRIRQQRNALAHETLKYISEHGRTDYAPLLAAMLALLERIESWWIVNIEVLCNEEYDGQEIHNEDVSSGVVIMMQLLVALALDPGQVTDHYLREQLRQPPSQSASGPAAP